MQRQFLAAILCLLTGLTACQPPSPPAATPIPQPTNQPTNNPTIQPTIQPTPQPTNNPTIQPTNQPTPTPFTPPDILYLAAAVEQSLADFDGISSYVIVNLETGGRIARHEDVAIAGMSLLKIPILAETYRVLDRPPDLEQTKLITQTTALSSNFAANLLLETIAEGRGLFAGADILTQSMRRLGLYNTFIAVPFDQEPQPDRLSTYLTPANQRADLTTHADPFRQTTIGDLARILEMIYVCAENDSGSLRELYADELSQPECQEILEMMRLNELARLLEAGLPQGTPFSHKVGWIDDTYGNVGIVFSPERDYLIGLALYTPTWLEWSIASPLFAEISPPGLRPLQRPPGLS